MSTLPFLVTRHARYVAAASLTAVVALHPTCAAAQAGGSGGSPSYQPDSSFVFEGLPWGADSATITRRMIASGWARTQAAINTKETGNNYLAIWENRPARVELFYDHDRFWMASVEVPVDSTQAVQFMTDVVGHIAGRHDLPGRLYIPKRGAGNGWATWKGRDANVVVDLSTTSPKYGPVFTTLLVVYQARSLPPE